MRLRISSIFVLAVSASVFCAGSIFVNAQAYGGRAYGINAATTINGTATTTVLTDTGSLPVTGGNISNTSQTTSVPGVISTGTVFSVSSGVLKSSQSTAVVNDLSIFIGGVTIRANRVTANANCICCPASDAGSCSGSVQISSLTIVDAAGGSTTVTVTGQPGQIVNLPNGLGTLTINEQVSSSGTITVNGLHIVASSNANSYNLVVASASALIDCFTVLPTPAEVTLSGRVTTQNGTGISGATVTVTNMSGVSRSAVTNSFGYYTLPGVTAGSSYSLTVSAKRYSFEPQLISVSDSMTINIVANN